MKNFPKKQLKRKRNIPAHQTATPTNLIASLSSTSFHLPLPISIVDPENPNPENSHCQPQSALLCCAHPHVTGLFVQFTNLISLSLPPNRPAKAAAKFQNFSSAGSLDGVLQLLTASGSLSFFLCAFLRELRVELLAYHERCLGSGDRGDAGVGEAGVFRPFPFPFRRRSGRLWEGVRGGIGSGVSQ